MIETEPKYFMNGWRTLRQTEEVEEGDYRWSHIKKCWIPVAKHRVGDLAIKPYTYARKEDSCNPGYLPEFTRVLKPDERIHSGDRVWNTHQKQFVYCPKELYNVKVGNVVTIIRG